MMKPKHKRLLAVVACIVFMSIGATILLNVFKENLIYFYSPTDVKEVQRGWPIKQNFRSVIKEIPIQKKIKLGGVVKEGSFIKKSTDEFEFLVTDNKNDIKIYYKGILPPIFREGQGIVAEGKMIDFVSFKAEKLITKHDENYMPPEVKDSLYEESYKNAPEVNK